MINIGVVTHGMSRTRVYKAWFSMMSRCYDTNHKAYKYYGGREDSPIRVCERWQTLENYLEDAVKLPNYDPDKKLTLDRIDPDGNYCPENCRWATNDVQQNNRRNNVVFNWRGKEMTLAEISRDVGVDYTHLADVYEWNKGHKDIEYIVNKAIKNANSINLAKVARDYNIPYARLYHYHITRHMPLQEAIDFLKQ